MVLDLHNSRKDTGNRGRLRRRPLFPGFSDAFAQVKA
jgi:hypothetical protein